MKYDSCNIHLLPESVCGTQEQNEGEEIDFLSSCPQDFIVVPVDKELLNRYSIALLGKEFDSIYSKGNRMKFKNESAKKESVDVLYETLKLALSSIVDLQEADFADKIEGEIIGSILSNIVPTDTDPLVNYAPRAERHKATKLARQYLMENMRKKIAILDICEAVGATERTLFLGFKELYGLTPKAYFNYLRLNNARRELLQAELGSTVTDVAYRWQFYHLSRFANSYYKMFGELPSETLKRSIGFNYSIKIDDIPQLL